MMAIRILQSSCVHSHSLNSTSPHGLPYNFHASKHNLNTLYQAILLYISCGLAVYFELLAHLIVLLMRVQKLGGHVRYNPSPGNLKRAAIDKLHLTPDDARP